MQSILRREINDIILWKDTKDPFESPSWGESIFRLLGKTSCCILCGILSANTLTSISNVLEQEELPLFLVIDAVGLHPKEDVEKFLETAIQLNVNFVSVSQNKEQHGLMASAKGIALEILSIDEIISMLKE